MTPRRQVNLPASTYQLQDFYLDTPNGKLARTDSPSKSIAQAENVVSPWRIRVRVEAEREDEDARPGRKGRMSASVSPSKQIARTITTTVPLKGSDDTPAPQKRGRGRPRKSGTPAKTPAKRPATPRPTQRKGKVTTDEDASDFSDASRGSNAPRSKRPKKKPTPKSKKTSQNVKSIRSLDEHQSQSQDAPSPPKRRGRPKKSFDIAVDADAGDNGLVDNTDEHSPTRGTDDRDPESTRGDPWGKTRQPLALTGPQKGSPKKSSKISSAPAHSDNEELSGYDSIAEGEDFSIVSLSTLPSAQQHLSSRAPLSSHTDQQGASKSPSRSESLQDTFTAEPRVQTIHPDSPEQDALTTKATETIHTTTKDRAESAPDHSSLLRINVKKATPSQLFSSPALPPMKPFINRASQVFRSVTNTTSELANKIQFPQPSQHTADSSDPVPESTTATSRGMEPPSQTANTRHSGSLFEGFGNRTRRELRAGLRLGEELAKRQQQVEAQAPRIHSSEDDVFQHIAKSTDQMSKAGELGLLGQEKVSEAIGYPQLLSRKQLPSPEPSVDEDTRPSTGKANTMLDSTAARVSTALRQEEQENHGQKHALTTSQASAAKRRNASPHSNIDNHTEDEAEVDNESPQKDVTDIWQSEARLTSNSQENSYLSGISVLGKPRRIRLPSLSSKSPEQVKENQSVEYASLEKQVTDLEAREDPKSAAGYSTPGPQKQPPLPEPSFTGFTNFTNDMLDVEEQQQPPKPVLGLAGLKRASVEDESDNIVATKRQRRSLYRAASINPKPSFTKRSFVTRRSSGQIEQATVKPISSERSVDRHSAKGNVHRTTDPAPLSWLSTISESLFQTATHALNSISAQEPLQVSHQATFSLPPTPAIPSGNLFTKQLPFNNAHYARLRTIYLQAQRHHELYPLKATSPSADLIGIEVESMGWRRKLEGWELAAVDDFLRVLEREGVDAPTASGLEAEGGAEDDMEIGVDEVVKRAFSLWVGQVQRDEVDLKDGVAGTWDRKFVANRKEILDRQRRWREGLGW